MSTRILDLIDRLIGSVPSGRSMAADFGPPPAVRYPFLAKLTDEQLYRLDGDTAIALAKAYDEAQLRKTMTTEGAR